MSESGARRALVGLRPLGVYSDSSGPPPAYGAAASVGIGSWLAASAPPPTTATPLTARVLRRRRRVRVVRVAVPGRGDVSDGFMLTSSRCAPRHTSASGVSPSNF